MLVPGTVKAGDKIIHEWGNRVKHRDVVTVERITSANDVIMDAHGHPFIQIEDGTFFSLSGEQVGLSKFHHELFPIDVV